MALIGKAKRYAYVLNEGVNERVSDGEILNIEEQKELYTLKLEDLGDVYVHLHSVTIWKDYADQSVEKRDLMNINYRVFKSKDDKIKDPESFIIEDDLLGQFIDFSLDKNVMTQAYELINGVLGFEELIND
tara:strand:+ start:243 stop:635 length:393 start_codon:yes stop_codon:yes gene_type:complete